MVERMATLDEKEELARLRIEFLRTIHPSMTVEEEDKIKHQLVGYYEKHLNKDLFIYVAAKEGEIVATVYLLIMEKPGNLNFITGRVGEVLNVYTKPEHRRKGIAKKLMLHMLLDSQKQQLSYVKLEATSEGYPMYKKLGFNDYCGGCKPMKYSFIGAHECLS